MAEKKEKGRIKKRVKEEVKKARIGVKKAGKEIKAEVLLNIPNTLTLLRLFLGFVLIYLIVLDYSYILIGLIFIIAALSDWLDGFFARKLNQTSAIGARLDQVVDRLFMVPVVLVLMIKFFLIDKSVFLLLGACMTREIIGFPGFVIRIIRNLDSYKVKYIGKLTTFFQSVAVASIVFQFDFAVYFAIIAGLVGIVAGFDYLRDSLK